MPHPLFPSSFLSSLRLIVVDSFANVLAPELFPGHVFGFGLLTRLSRVMKALCTQHDLAVLVRTPCFFIAIHNPCPAHQLHGHAWRGRRCLERPSHTRWYGRGMDTCAELTTLPGECGHPRLRTAALLLPRCADKVNEKGLNVYLSLRYSDFFCHVGYWFTNQICHHNTCSRTSVSDARISNAMALRTGVTEDTLTCSVVSSVASYAARPRMRVLPRRIHKHSLFCFDGSHITVYIRKHKGLRDNSRCWDHTRSHVLRSECASFRLYLRCETNHQPPNRIESTALSK